MLSRAAESLYRLGRQLERADHLARLVEVHHGLWLDRPAGAAAQFWPDFAELVGFRRPSRLGTWDAIGMVLAEPTGPSVRNAVQSARRAAMAFRPSLSAEVFQQINRMHWELEEMDHRQDLHALLSRVQLGVHLAFGLIDETMAHDIAWDFVGLGKAMERARLVTSLVMYKLRTLKRSGDDPVQWAAVLRCCYAFEAYRLRYSAPVTPARVTGFLLLDRTLPRSAGFCIHAGAGCVERIDGPRQRSRPRRVIGQLASVFEYTDDAEVVAAPEAFASTFGRFADQFDEALREIYFRPRRVAAGVNMPAPQPAWAMSQEQQQQ